MITADSYRRLHLIFSLFQLIRCLRFHHPRRIHYVHNLRHLVGVRAALFRHRQSCAAEDNVNVGDDKFIGERHGGVLVFAKGNCEEYLHFMFDMPLAANACVLVYIQVIIKFKLRKLRSYEHNILISEHLFIYLFSVPWKLL